MVSFQWPSQVEVPDQLFATARDCKTNLSPLTPSSQQVVQKSKLSQNISSSLIKLKSKFHSCEKNMCFFFILQNASGLKLVILRTICVPDESLRKTRTQINRL